MVLLLLNNRLCAIFIILAGFLHHHDSCRVFLFFWFFVTRLNQTLLCSLSDHAQRWCSRAPGRSAWGSVGGLSAPVPGYRPLAVGRGRCHAPSLPPARGCSAGGARPRAASEQQQRAVACGCCGTAWLRGEGTAQPKNSEGVARSVERVSPEDEGVACEGKMIVIIYKYNKFNFFLKIYIFICKWNIFK